MKQAQNQTQTIQVLYELALAIGSSLDLDQMLTTSMQAFADKLDCAVSTVYRCQTSKTACQFDAVGTNSPQADKMETVQLALAHLPTTSDEQVVAQFMATLPLVAQGAADDFYHLLGLPGFGVLLLVKDKAPLDEGLMVGIRPLQEKLAVAANACLSQEQTHNSQGQSQTILESITTPLLISRISDGLILYANDLLADMIGTTAAQLIGNVTPDFYANTADRTTLLTKLQAQGLLTNYELQIKKSSGELIWVLLSIKPFNYQGDPALIATFLDITERKQVLQQLRDSRERARSILESVTLPLIISRLDDGTVLYANERVLEMMGMEADEIIGNQTPNFYQNPADRTKVIQEAVAHGGIDNMELPIWRKGESRWALISNRLTQYDDQQAIITTLIDITDRKLAEEAQTKRAAELETVARVSASTASILETDKLLQDVVDLTKERFGLYHAHVYLLNKAGDKLMLTAGAGEIGQQMVVEKRSIPLNQEQSLVAQAARTRKGVIENDVLNNPAFLPHPLLPDTRAEMAVPMLIGDKVIGVLDTQADQVGWFTQQDILIKTTLAAQVAVALENARSFESARTSLAETEALLDITKESSRTLELQAILESVLDRVMAATKFEAGLISLENPDTHVLELYNHRLPAKFLQVLQKNGLDNTLCDLVYRRQESIVVDLNGDTPVDVSGLVKLGYNSYQGVPIAAKGDVFGTICLFSTHRLDSDEANTVFLQAVGQQVGIAIQNANLLKQTQVALTEVEQSREVVQEYLDMQRVLHEMNAELLQVDDLDELYRRAIELAHTRLGFERIGMYLLNEAKDTLLGTYGVDVAGNIRSEQGPEHVITDPATINTFVLNRTRLSVAEDIDLLQENEVVGHGWHMGAAMWAEEAAIGVIFADNLLTGQPLKPYQSELLFAYAGAVANLILRRRVEKTIRERETLLRTIIDSTPDWIFVKDQNHRYLLVNQGYADSMQMAPEEFIGKNDLDIGFPEDIVKGNAEKGIRGFWADDLEIMESGQVKVIDIEPAVIEGEQRYLNTIKAPLKDANDAVTAVIGFVHDITDRVQIEETIRERETLLRTIIDSTPDWIFVKGRDHRYQLVNQGYAKSFNMEPDAFIGKNDLEIGFPEEIVKGNPEKGIVGFWPDDDEVMASGETKVIDVEPGEVDGKEVFLSTIKSPLKDEEGNATAVVGFVHDITERIQSERKTRERETLLRTIIDSTPDWIFVKDRNHRYQLVNQGYADSMHMAPEEFIGKNDLDIGFPEEIVKGNPEKGIRGFWADDTEIMDSGERQIIDEEPAVIDNEPRVLSTVKAPLYDSSGEVTALVGFVHDITERKRIEEAIAKQAKELQVVAELSTTVATTLESEKLLQDVVDLTKERFGFYHVQIYLLNAQQEKLALAFGAGDVGYQLVAQKHQIDMNATQSLVAQAARFGQAVVVNDVRENPHWLPNELLPKTQAEMVVPLMVGDRLLGVLDVQSDRVNRFTDQDVQIQTTLAAQVSIAMENARSFEQAQTAFRNVEQSQAELSQALEISKLAYWEYDVEQDLFTFNDQFYSIFHTTAEAHGGYQLSSGYYAQNFVHPEDTAMVGGEIGLALSSTDRYYNRLLEHRILYGDGGIGYISVNVTLERNEEGEIIRFYGANQDITDRKLSEEVLRRSEAELSQALKIAKLSYWEYDVEKDLFTFNDQFYALFNTTAEQHGGYQLSSAYYAEHFVHPDDLPMVGGAIEQALKSTDMHYSRSLEHRILYADGSVGYISVNINIDRDEQGNILRYYGANQDITERKRIESAIAKQAQELQIVAELSTTVATTLEQEKLLQEVVDLTKERFEFYHTQIYLLNAQQNRLSLAFGAGDVGRTLVAQQHQIALNAPQSLVAQAARSGQAVVVNDVRENLDWLPNKLLPETQAEMAVPMMVGDRVVGVLDVQSASVNRFTDQDVQIQTTLAAQVSIALENARSFEQAQTAVAEMNALTRRLTHEGWDDYFDNVRDEKLSFSFDGTSVQDVQDTAVNATLQDELIELLERPIEVRGVKIGKMALMPEEEDPELEEVVNSVMQQLASHIENLRLTEQVQISLAQTEALYTGSERIVLSSTEADILESLIYSTQLRNLERANIFLFDQPVEDNVARDVTVVAVWENEGVPHTVDVGARFTVDQVPFLSMVTSEAAMVVADIREDPRIDEATRQILEGYGMTSFVLFPMVVGSQWLGIVSGQSARPLYINDVQHRQTSSLVSQASVVLQTTILFRQEQARARREQMLRAIATKVRSSTDVDSIMRTAVTEIGRTLGRRAFIKLSDGQLMETAEENGVAL